MEELEELVGVGELGSGYVMAVTDYGYGCNGLFNGYTSTNTVHRVYNHHVSTYDVCMNMIVHSLIVIIVNSLLKISAQ